MLVYRSVIRDDSHHCPIIPMHHGLPSADDSTDNGLNSELLIQLSSIGGVLELPCFRTGSWEVNHHPFSVGFFGGSEKLSGAYGSCEKHLFLPIFNWVISFASFLVVASWWLNHPFRKYAHLKLDHLPQTRG